MPNITPSRKGGTSVDCSDLLAQKKRNIYLAIARNSNGKGGGTQQSNKQLGYDNGFMELKSKKGLDEYLVRNRKTSTLIPYSIFGGGGYANNVTYANNTWVIVGDDGSGSNPENNVYYGTDLGNLTDLSIFGSGYAYNVTYANNTWVIVGDDGSGLNNVYYGPTLGSLIAYPIFGSGYAYNVTYDNNTWVIVGDDGSGSNNVYYGTTLGSLTPYSIFGSGYANNAIYANNTWVIVGYDGSGSNNVYYGTSF